jgi:hypothetical protein
LWIVESLTQAIRVHLLASVGYASGSVKNTVLFIRMVFSGSPLQIQSIMDLGFAVFKDFIEAKDRKIEESGTGQETFDFERTLI